MKIARLTHALACSRANAEHKDGKQFSQQTMVNIYVVLRGLWAAGTPRINTLQFMDRVTRLHYNRTIEPSDLFREHE